MMSNINELPAFPGKTWLWRGERIYYVKGGESSTKQRILLIHGFGASTDHWRKNIGVLAGDFEIWALDLLGFGRSAKPASHYSVDLWREQVRDFITEVIGSPATIVGNSLGGYVATSVAADRPELVSSVVLLNSMGSFVNPNATSTPFQKKVNNLLSNILRQPSANQLLFRYMQRKSFIKSTLLKVYANPEAVTDRLVEEIYRPACEEGAIDVFSSIFSSPPGEKIDRLLARMNCPLLLIWGEKDPWVNARNRSKKFREYYPQLREYYLDSGHCPHDDTPEQVNFLLKNWCRELTMAIDSKCPHS